MLLRNIIFLVIFFCFSCKQGITFENNDRKRSDSIFTCASDSFFINDKTSLAIDTVQKVYHSIINPTFWDTKNYYTITGVAIGRGLGKFNLAVSYFDTLLNIVENGNSEKLTKTEIAYLYIEIAYAYFEMAIYGKAIDYYFKAENILQGEQNNCEKLDLIHAIAIVLYKQKDYDNSVVYFKKELDIILRCKPTFNNIDPSNEQQVLNNIGLCYYKLNQLKSAKNYFKAALNLIEKSKYVFRKDSTYSVAVYNSCKGVVLGNLAKIFVKNQDFETAIRLYKQAILYNSPNGYEKGDAQICRLQLAELFYQVKNFNEMKTILDDYRTEKTKSINIDSEIDWLRLMSLYYNETNDFENEINFYKHYISKRDSVNAVKNNSEFTTITKELESKQQKLEIGLLQKNNQVSKLYTSLFAVGLVLVTVLAYFIFRNYKKEQNNLKVLTRLNNEIILQQKATEEALQQVSISNQDKDRILNVVAHDLRNPIGAIANFLEIIKTKFKHNEEEEKILNNSQLAAVRSLHLINDLLEVNKLQSDQLKLNKQYSDIIELINQSIQQVKFKTLAKQQKIKFISNEESIYLNIDEDRIQRVIENLIDNAVKFSYLKGTIDILLYTNNDNMILQVRDYGMGIPDNLQKHLFTQSIIAKRKGTNNEPSNGLGLSICKQIIEAHDGKIWVQSEEKKGSIFFIELPLT